MNQPSDKVLREVGLALCDAAYKLFVRCGAGNDFCVQAVSGTRVV